MEDNVPGTIYMYNLYVHVHTNISYWCCMCRIWLQSFSIRWVSLDDKILTLYIFCHVLLSYDWSYITECHFADVSDVWKWNWMIVCAYAYICPDCNQQDQHDVFHFSYEYANWIFLMYLIIYIQSVISYRHLLAFHDILY